MTVIIQDNQVETLRHLGLSNLQARTYLVLVQMEEADIKTIALSAKVARQDMYRIISSLEKLGLVKKVIAQKNMYVAAPINQGLSNLLNEQKRAFVETHKQVERMLSNFCQRKYFNSSSEDPKFTITSERTLLESMLEDLSDNAKETIDVILPSIRPLDLKSFLKNFSYINKALKRSIKVRVIIISPKKRIDTHEKERFSKELIEIRYLPENSILFGMHIFDGKQVTLAVSEKPLPGLWTNCSHVVQLASVYFENLWLQAAK